MRPARLLVAALALLATVSASAQPVPLDSLARAYAAEYGLPSLVVGVTVGGERHVAAVGDVHGAPADAHTLYEIGSITKVLTSLALAEAVTRGDLSLETPVRDLLPDSAMVAQHEAGPVRLWHLATHTSGLPRVPIEMGFQAGFDMADPYALYGPEQLYATLSTPRSETAPGETYAYSNLGAGLLGFALSQHAGVSYADLVRSRILRPLGMDESFVDVPDSLAGRFAQAHGANGTPVPHWTAQDPIAGAGMVRSTVADLLTLAEAALDPTATPLADALALTLEPRAEAGDDREVGLGWHLSTLDDGTRIAGHGGGTGGSTSSIIVAPEAGVGVVLLTNRASPAASGVALDLIRRILAE